MRAWLVFLASIVAAAPAWAAPAGAPSPGEIQKAANELVEKWLSAQNRRDFAAYQALYAETFKGTKRVGKEAKSYDRTSWLADRKTMFAADQKVSIKGLTVTMSPPLITLDFVQTWEQGTFADTGPKRMVIDLARTNGAILSEELLSSRQILASRACIKAMYPEARGDRIAADKSADKIVTVETYDLGTSSFACRVAHRAAGESVTVNELAVLVRAGKAWQEIERERIDLEDNVSGPDEPGGTSHDLAFSILEAGQRESLLVVEQEDRETGPMSDQGKRRARLLRATRNGFIEAMSYESTWSNGEADQGTKCTLKTLDKIAMEFRDLELTCVEYTGSWHDEDPKDRGTRETTEVTIYRWDGIQYEVRRRKNLGTKKM